MAQRLRRIVRHVGGAGAAAAPTELGGLEQPTEVAPPLRLLSDAEMEQFVAMGYISLPVAEFGPEFHRAIHERAGAHFGDGRGGVEFRSGMSLPCTGGRSTE